MTDEQLAQLLAALQAMQEAVIAAVREEAERTRQSIADWSTHSTRR